MRGSRAEANGFMTIQCESDQRVKLHIAEVKIALWLTMIWSATALVSRLFPWHPDRTWVTVGDSQVCWYT